MGMERKNLAWSNSPFSPSLADPNGSGAVVAAVQWLQGTLLGTAATSVAVVSVATVGLMMLSGRIDVRRGAATIVGCFILFGAASIAAGIQAAAFAAAGSTAPDPPMAASAPAGPVIPPPPPAAAPSNADPYAGAAVPNR
jgi:type IV secretory pathway VirB2 component (pilin)